MSNYSPFKAAIAQLHTPEAIAYYKLRAEQDVQSVAVVTVKIGVAFYQAAVMTYGLGIFIRALYESTKPVPETMPQPLLPSAPVLLALPAAKPERTMVQRLDAIASRQAERQVPSVGVIYPPTTFKAPKASKAKSAPKREPVGIAGRKKPTMVRGVAID